MIKAEIVAHSLSPQGDELISVLATFPRIILAEVNTHRMLSKNTSSSRAIPFNKMVEAIENNPFIPIAWQKEHKGMQGNEYFTDERDIKERVDKWLVACSYAIENAKSLTDDKVTKQLANRLLEPFMWTTMLITGPKSGWDNLFNLRCPQYYFEPEDKSYKSKKEWVNVWNATFETGKDVSRPAKVEDWDNLFWLAQNKGHAEIHMMALAEAIYDAVNESAPKQLRAGEWHIPFENKMDLISIAAPLNKTTYSKEVQEIAVKIAVAMAARTSYTVVGEEKSVNFANLISLHDRLISQNPPHSSPMEHCAKAMDDLEYNFYIKGETGNYNPDTSLSIIPEAVKGWCRNFKGFIPYRHIIESK